MSKKKIIISVVALGFVFGAIAFLAAQHREQCVVCFGESINADVIKHFIKSFGPWAVFVYVALYTLNTLILVPPIAFMSLSAGAIFGPVWGTIALASGSFCGTTATFVISRYFGGKLVDKFVKGKAADFNEKLSKNGFIVLLPMRLVGFPPYEFVNYASGLSKISYKDFIAATMIGMSPAIIIQVLLADRLVNFSWKDPVLYVVVVLFIGMGAITGKIIKKQQGEKAAQSAQ